MRVPHEEGQLAVQPQAALLLPLCLSSLLMGMLHACLPAPRCSAPGISVNDAATTTTSTTAKVTPPTLGGELLYSTSTSSGRLLGASHCCTVVGCCCAVLHRSASTGCSAASLTSASLLPPSACVLPGPFTNYKLTVCPTGSAQCKTFNCAPANIAACPLTGLDPATSYNVVVVAQKTGAPDSLAGGPDTFKTKSPE